ncbi:TniQ family protein [Pseudomonas frederiksbergensis]|nr:TniQ family protein [Pseudomonas frederiksbergensis]
MDKVAVLDPDSFKFNLDAALQIPPNLSKRAGSTSSSLESLQVGVLEARNYESFIVPDLGIYGNDQIADLANTATMVKLILASPEAGFVFFGVPGTFKWMTVALKEAFIGCRTTWLRPMPAGSEFDDFIRNVALHVQPPCPPGGLERLNADAVHAQSRGWVGRTVTTLIQQIVDDSLPKATTEYHQPNKAPETGQEQRQEQEQEQEYTHQQLLMWSDADPATVAPDWEETGGGTGDDLQELVIASGLMPTKLRHSVPAIDNESFSSWIARLSQTMKHSIEFLLVDELVHHCSKGGTDPDMQFGNLELLQSLSVADRLYISGQFKTFSTDMIPYPRALNYCPECFRCDLASGLSPAWRLEWRQPRRCVCLRHDTPALLERFVTPGFTILDKAWRAFAEYTESPASRLPTKFPLQHSSSEQSELDSDRLVALAAHVQSWFLGLSATTQPSAKAAEFLLACWLQDLNESGAQGFARSYFFFRLTKPSSARKRQRGEVAAELNPDTSRPRDVAVAYWMLGIGFGVIDSTEAEFIRTTTRPYTIPFPVTRSEVGAVGFLALSRGQKYSYLELAKSTLNEREFESIAWALDNHVRPYRKHPKDLL